MSTTSQSLFLYSYEVTQFNSSIDFRAVAFGPILTATLQFGSYSATQLLEKVKASMEAVDPLNIYSASIDRTTLGGTENRITISTNGAYLDLLWLTGPRNFSSACTLLGFNQVDNTGATSYTGNFSSGIILIPDYFAYSYLGPDFMRTVFGAKSITASGIKETIVWQVQKFFQAEFKHQPYNKVVTEWTDFLTWAIQQKPFEFTPEISSPSVFYQATLETTGADGNGMGFSMAEELPEMPFLYRTGTMKFRQIL